MNFQVLSRRQTPPASGCNTAYLVIDHWNDYSFVTMFFLSLHDELGNFHELGNVKIGFKGQTTETSTYSTLGNAFPMLSNIYFSLGQEVDYYRKAGSELSEPCRVDLFTSLCDVAFDESCLNTASDEAVFSTSLLRGVGLSTIRGQFRRVLSGGVPVTDFKFSFKRQPTETFSGLDLSFEVKASSIPSTNIHACIGRNGVGKTSLLNGMIHSITNHTCETGAFFNDEQWWTEEAIDSTYFSNLVSVSFSAFDPFVPPAEQRNPALGTCYYYIGLKKDEIGLKTLPQLHSECVEALRFCFSVQRRQDRWVQAIRTLESDENFEAMHLTALTSVPKDELERVTLGLLERMSSGHAVVLLTMTKLVATVEEKTLVLIDEPESHLHPPLLSAFMRALSELLHDRNGVAIIATHSPVVLQEIPKSCVWKITRSRLAVFCSRPDMETFGENVGTLTREVFRLEVIKSGFHQVLEQSVQHGESFEEIMEAFNNQLGLEGQAILRAMIWHQNGDN